MKSGAPEESEFEAEIAGRAGESHFAAVYGGDPQTRAVAASEDFVALVDLAPLALGHLLVVPRTDFPSFSALPPALWSDWERFRARLSKMLADHWAEPAILEHGSTYEMEGGACITHAHLHLLPLECDILSELRADGLELHEIADHRDIPKHPERPYLFCEQAGEGSWFAWADNPPLPRQYIRRVVARLLGYPSHSWDWGVVVQRDLLRQTVRELGRSNP